MDGIFHLLITVIESLGNAFAKVIDATKADSISTGFWSDTTRGVIIGGLVGLLPSFISLVVEARRQKRQQTHELCLKKIETYEIPRRDAILDFMRRLGAMCSDNLESEHETADFFASYHKARPYVAEETRQLMDAASQLVLESWVEHRDVSPKDMLRSREIKALSEAVGRELLTSKYQNSP